MRMPLVHTSSLFHRKKILSGPSFPHIWPFYLSSEKPTTWITALNTEKLRVVSQKNFMATHNYRTVTWFAYFKASMALHPFSSNPWNLLSVGVPHAREPVDLFHPTSYPSTGFSHALMSTCGMTAFSYSKCKTHQLCILSISAQLTVSRLSSLPAKFM